MGHLLDSEYDMLGSGRFLTFETEHLMNLGEKAVVAVLLYLFRRNRETPRWRSDPRPAG
jgi:type IV secretion system protein VirB4